MKCAQMILCPELLFSSMLLPCQNISFSNTLVYEQIYAKPFPLASYVIWSKALRQLINVNMLTH